MDKAFAIQKQIRDNAKTLNSYLTDLQNWESEMKRKEAAISGELEQAIPAVRSKLKKEKPVAVKKKQEPRISASDYLSWEKFDVDKACEDVDMKDRGPASLDGKKSTTAKMEKLREEALHEKERGNNFVKLGKWDEAISCYNRAIELVQDDAIYYANRGLCYLKKDNFHQAETDCSAALRLDPTYVKALQRRATARERLGALRAAVDDLAEVVRLEPRNKAAAAQYDLIKTRMNTKGANQKSSPTAETKPVPSKAQKIIELAPRGPDHETAADRWKAGVGENITVLRPVKKPPHLRSKRELKSIHIQEIPIGKSSPEKPPTRLKIIEIDSQVAQDSNKQTKDLEIKELANGDVIEKSSPESVKLIMDVTSTEKRGMIAPVNSVQFMSEWNNLKWDEEGRCQYFYLIEPEKLPSIFEHALESSVLSEVLYSIALHPSRVHSYLRALCNVKRFPALVMFLTPGDKLILEGLVKHCEQVENCTASQIADLKIKYELNP